MCLSVGYERVWHWNVSASKSGSAYTKPTLNETQQVASDVVKKKCDGNNFILGVKKHWSHCEDKCTVDAAHIILQISIISASIQSNTALLPQAAPGLSMCDSYMNSVWWHNPTQPKSTFFSKSLIIKDVMGVRVRVRVRPPYGSVVTY